MGLKWGLSNIYVTVSQNVKRYSIVLMLADTFQRGYVYNFVSEPFAKITNFDIVTDFWINYKYST